MTWNTIQSIIYTHFNTLWKKALGKRCGKMKLLKMSHFSFFHNVFYAICILKSFNSQISFVVCSFFEFGMVSKWGNREWLSEDLSPQTPGYGSFTLQHRATQHPVHNISAKKIEQIKDMTPLAVQSDLVLHTVQNQLDIFMKRTGKITRMQLLCLQSPM